MTDIKHPAGPDATARKTAVLKRNSAPLCTQGGPPRPARPCTGTQDGRRERESGAADLPPGSE